MTRPVKARGLPSSVPRSVLRIDIRRGAHAAWDNSGAGTSIAGTWARRCIRKHRATLKRADCHFEPPREDAHSTAAWAMSGSASVRPWRKARKSVKQSAFSPHCETKRSPQFKVALQVIFEIGAGHADLPATEVPLDEACLRPVWRKMLVVSRRRCPRTSATCFNPTPRLTIRVAAVCLKACELNRGSKSQRV